MLKETRQSEKIISIVMLYFQTRFTRHSRPAQLDEISPVVAKKSTARQRANDLPNEAMTSRVTSAPGNEGNYLKSRREMGHVVTTCESRDGSENSDVLGSYQNHGDGILIDKECDMMVCGENVRHDMDNKNQEGSKAKSDKQLKTMVNRLAPTPGFVDKNSLPSDLMTRNRVRRVASLNAAAKVNVFFEQSSPLAGRSITDITAHSKKVQGEANCQEFVGGSFPPVKAKGRPTLASISTNDSNFLRSPELLHEAAHAFLGMTHELNSENSVSQKQHRENSASLKRFEDADWELHEAKRPKLDGGFVRHKHDQNGDYGTIVCDRRFVKGKEVVDVGLQVKIPKLRPGISPDTPVQCTCRSSTVRDIPVKSYVSTYANGTLVSIPITKTHRLTPQVPEKPLPELAQGDLANRSKRVAGLNSRAMLNAILCEERQLADVQNISKPARKLQPKKSYYEHGLSNTVPSKLKIPKINFAATSTSNFGGRKIVGTCTSKSMWSKSGLISHDGPKVTIARIHLILT